MDGGVEAGPNAVLALKREGYRWRDVSLRDLAGIAAWPGFWHLAARFWRIGAYEVRRSLSQGGSSCAICSGWCRRSGPADVHRAGSGVRAQALDAKGGLVDDFRIVRSERAVHVLNAPSPGATASIRIGERIAAMAEEGWIDVGAALCGRPGWGKQGGHIGAAPTSLYLPSDS